MKQNAEKEPESAKRKALGPIGTLIGIAVGWYSGANLFVPLAATAIVWWGGKKILKDANILFLPAFAVQNGHLLWLILGLVYVGKVDGNILDVVVLAAGLTWLVLRPGLGPVLLLGIYQAFALIVNFVHFLDAAVGTVMHQALLVHIIWRVLALFFMGQAYRSFRSSGEVARELTNGP